MTEPRSPQPKEDRSTAARFIAAMVIVVVLVMLFSVATRGGSKAPSAFDDWSSFLAAIEDGAVTSVELGQHQVDARLAREHELVPTTGVRSRHDLAPLVSVTYPGGNASDALVAEVRAAVDTAKAAGHEVAITGSHESGMPGWVAALLAAMALGTVITILFIRHRRRWQRMNAPGGPGGNGGRAGPGGQPSPGRLIQRGELGVRFADVAGIDEAKEEIEEVVEFLRSPQAFEAIGAKIPSGLLLVGPPGTGKTLLAKAVAGEAGCNFLEVSGSDFVEMLVGVGAARVRALFEQARKFAPCILFIDEIDAIAKKRSDGSGAGGGSVEHEQTLNAFLVELDGFRNRERIILMGATNRVDVLDPAILRPGRCDRQVNVDLPDRHGRREILEVHARKVKLAAEVDLDRVARATPGFSGAGLANLINEAAIHAARGKRAAIDLEDLEWARDKVAFGKEQGGRFRAMSEHEKRITAYHEAGHAVVQLSLQHTDEIHKVTIVPRGQMLGAVMSLPDDRQSQTRSRLLDQICVLYGGRVAEESFCDDVTAGACNDIERATRIGHKMVFELGMSENVGLIKYEAASVTGGDGHQVSESSMAELDAEVKRILRRQHERARSLVDDNREWVERIVAALLSHETLTGDQVRDLRAEAAIEDSAVAYDDTQHDR